MGWMGCNGMERDGWDVMGWMGWLGWMGCNGM